MAIEERMQKSLELIESLGKEGMEPHAILSFLCASHAMACAMFDMSPEAFKKINNEMCDKYPIMYSGCQTLKKCIDKDEQRKT